MSYSDNPIAILAQVISHAQYQAFDPVEYQDRNWEKYKKWKKEHFDILPKEQRAELYLQEQKTGIPMEPSDCYLTKRRRPHLAEMQVQAMFPQLWGSTALGFGGIGGAAMTTAYTTVIECYGQYAVYFGGGHAYTLRRPNQQFWADIAARFLKSVEEHSLYEEE